MNPARRRSLAAVALLVGAACVGLGLWQLGRLEERRADNEDRRARLEAPPVRLGPDAGLASLPPAESLAWRRAEATGRFAYDEEVVLAPRSWSGSPAVYLLTPLLVGDSTALPVLRGAVPAPDGFHAPIGRARPPGGGERPDGVAAPSTTEPPETVRVRGLLLPGPEPGDAAGPDTLHAAGGVHPVLARLDLARVDSLLPWRVPAVYLHADSTTVRIPAGGGPAVPIPVPPPTLDDGPHLAYAIQWFSFAAIALVGGLIVLFRGQRSVGDG